MKKICIITKKMVIGGIEKSLLEMIKNIQYFRPDIEITLFIMAGGGELIKEIPRNVIVKEIFNNRISTRCKITNELKSGNILKALKIGIFTLMSSSTKNIFKSYKYIAKTVPNNEEVYDLAIAYHTPISFPVIYAIDNIKANKKISWIHSDLKQYIGVIENYKKYYEKYNHIFSVSSQSCEVFKDIFPEFSNKVSILKNSINKEEIKKNSMEQLEINKEFNGLTIATVGRLSYEKGYDLIINVLKKLVDENLDVRWICVGDGPERKKLEKEILFNNLQKNILLLGGKKNPLPYIGCCDIYIQPSRHEGYGISVAEAKCLEKPIIVTNVNGLREQIFNKENGLVVNIEENQIYFAIKELIENSVLKRNIVLNLSKEIIDTRDEVKKIFNFL